jgi:CBS domain containing-hemolysin-like protein
MRKLLLSAAALLLLTGLAAAAEVTLVRYDKDKKELTVKDDKDQEKTYTITNRTKVFFGDQEGQVAAIEKVLTNKAAPGKLRMELATDKGEVTRIKTRRKKK